MEPGESFIFLDGTKITATLHGPMIWGDCADCFTPTLVVQSTDRYNQHGLKEDNGIPEPRCTSCARRRYGLDP